MMKDKLVTFKDLELAAKSYYGEGAELEIVEPVVLLPYKGGVVEEGKSFYGGVDFP